jgi:RimJ/RimL family protein N-acetyltransferase
MSIAIRRIESADAKGFYDALTSVANERKYLLTVEPAPFDELKEFVLTNIAINAPQYVADFEGTIIGWADITSRTNHKSMSHVGSLGMGVISKFRGKGVGNRLLTETIDHAWKTGFKRLEIEVFSDNEIAIHLYKKHGYLIEGVKKKARFIDGVYQDIVIMGQVRT